MSLGIALIGAGIFATKEHLPAIQGCSDLTLKAVYARSKKSAQTLADLADCGADVFFATPEAPEKSLDALLERSDIDAVIIAVPISETPALVRQALSAGKHVLSEKPIAPDLHIAKELLAFAECQSSVFWAVGENMRFWNSINEAQRQLQEIGGKLASFEISVANFTDAKNPFFHTKWRQNPTFQGGYLLDGGVHFTAVLRYLLAPLNTSVTSVSAHTSLLQEALTPADTIAAILKTSNGCLGSFSICLGSEFKRGMVFENVTDNGKVRVDMMKNVVKTTKASDGTLETVTTETEMTWGVKEEVAAFAESISSGLLDSRLAASEALADLTLLEAMLVSAGRNGSPVSVSEYAYE